MLLFSLALHIIRVVRRGCALFRFAISAASLVGVALSGGAIAAAQQPPTRPPKPDTSMAGMSGMTGAHAPVDTGMNMSMGMMMMPGPLGIPMTRMGSGTSWLPDSAPMHAHHVMAGPWELMLHGVAFGMYDRQNGTRGAEQFSSVNWGMLMARRAAAGGMLTLRGMMSLEAFTVGGNGYPLLLQTGEEYQGQPLHDRQHPHDLFMELAAQYERAITKSVGLSLYAAPVGEPASGPVAFPHRPSAMNDPLAPIGHHWQDATHIAFGVLTAGLFTHSVKVEGSLFNGREPDENRTNFDYRGRSLDSYSGRVTWNPAGQWSVAGSYAYLKSPETTHPEESMHRVSASLLNNRSFGSAGDWSTTLVFGANRASSDKTFEPSYLAETNLEFGNGHTVFGRAEYVDKTADDLVLGANPPARTFNVGELTGGYLYEFDRIGTVRTGLGVRAAVNFVPSSLVSVYGSRNPTGFAIFVRFRPAPMTGHGVGAGPGHSMNGMDMGGAQQPDRSHELERARDIRISRDTTMGAMPGMRMPTATPPNSAMPGMPMSNTPRDSMAGMRMPATSSDTSKHPTTMPEMKGVPGTSAKPTRDTSMSNMPGMNRAAPQPPAKSASAAKGKIVAGKGGATTTAKKKAASGAKAQAKSKPTPRTSAKTPAKPKSAATPAASMPGMSMPAMKMPADTAKKPPIKKP